MKPSQVFDGIQKFEQFTFNSQISTIWEGPKSAPSVLKSSFFFRENSRLQKGMSSIFSRAKLSQTTGVFW